MHHHITNKMALALLTLVTALMAGCSGWNPNESANAEQEVKQAIAEFKKHDPSIKTFFDKAYAYAIYPSVGKGGIGIGGAYGSGMVYQHGRLIGHTTLTQVSIGWQLGGQAYREIIFFENEKALNTFKNGDLKLSAEASAVAATAGAAAKTSYAHNMAVFTMIKGGLMYEATVAGQSFSFEPVK